jgi:hypothetical protein
VRCETAFPLGSTKVEHVDDALAAESLSLTDEHIARPAATNQPRP